MSREMNYNKISKSKFLGLLLMILLSCCKDDNVLKEIPVKYYLTYDQKQIFKNFESDTITFVCDDLDKSITFVSDEIIDHLNYLETDTRKGESLSVFYKSDIDYLPNLGFAYDLNALEDGSCSLAVTFGTGTYWNERNSDYNFSYFYLNPFRNKTDSIYISQEWFTFTYLDSLSFGKTTFRNLYFLPKSTYTGFDNVVYNCYYQVDKGIIAFTDINNKKWIANQ